MGEILVMREPNSSLSIIYNSNEKRPESEQSYEGCKRQIDDAFRGKIISEEAQHILKRELTDVYVSNIVFNNTERKRDSVRALANKV